MALERKVKETKLFEPLPHLSLTLYLHHRLVPQNAHTKCPNAAITINICQERVNVGIPLDFLILLGY